MQREDDAARSLAVGADRRTVHPDAGEEPVRPGVIPQPRHTEGRPLRAALHPDLRCMGEDIALTGNVNGLAEGEFLPVQRDCSRVCHHAAADALGGCRGLLLCMGRVILAHKGDGDAAVVPRPKLLAHLPLVPEGRGFHRFCLLFKSGVLKHSCVGHLPRRLTGGSRPLGGRLHHLRHGEIRVIRAFAHRGDGAVVFTPGVGEGVFVLRRSVGCLVGCIPGHGSNCRIPPGKGVGVGFIRRLHRRLTRVSRHLTVGDRTALQLRVIIVDEFNCECPQLKRRRHGNIFRRHGEGLGRCDIRRCAALRGVGDANQLIALCRCRCQGDDFSFFGSRFVSRYFTARRLLHRDRILCFFRKGIGELRCFCNSRRSRICIPGSPFKARGRLHAGGNTCRLIAMFHRFCFLCRRSVLPRAVYYLVGDGVGFLGEVCCQVPGTRDLEGIGIICDGLTPFLCPADKVKAFIRRGGQSDS